ncbi:MAG: hypothetical protein HKN36_06390 [Hellea sp.]|nr:hypothetical protein [Hellea sp.]
MVVGVSKGFLKLSTAILVATSLVACPDGDQTENEENPNSPELTAAQAACQLPELPGLDRAGTVPDTAYFVNGQKVKRGLSLTGDTIVANHKDISPYYLIFKSVDPNGFEKAGYSLTIISETDDITLESSVPINAGTRQIDKNSTNGKDGGPIKFLAPQGSITISGNINGNRGSIFGGDGGDIIFCARDKISIETGAFIVAGHGGSYAQDAKNDITEKNHTLIGRRGGRGGNIYFIGTGPAPVTVTINGRVTAGKGGAGEAADITGGIGNRSITGHGGTGGEGGTAYFDNATATIAKAEYLRPGDGGNGGNASVWGSDGESGPPPSDGGNAVAEGGWGGAAGKIPLNGFGAKHGNGGNARAYAGRGGTDPGGTITAASGSASAFGGGSGTGKRTNTKPVETPPDPSGTGVSAAQDGEPGPVQKTP